MSELAMLPSSQGSITEMPSSPIAAPSANKSSKPRKPPSITPRRFTRFFSPMTTRSGANSKSKSSRRLKDITKNANNQDGPHAPPKFHGFQDFQDVQFETPRKKRKILPTPESSPVQPLDSSPLRPSNYTPPRSIAYDDLDSLGEVSEEDDEEEKHFPTPITRLRDTGSSNRILQRSFGGSRSIGRGKIYDHCASYQAQTSQFYSRPEDNYNFRGAALPFCVAHCNTNPLVAVGDEEGNVRLIDSANDTDFGTEHVHFKPHRNAIMDVAFSSDDYLLATASGDQTARITDMRTQQIRFIMHEHSSSVKQVRFMPGNDSIVATSSRDGSVQIWDLRCRGTQAAASDFNVTFTPGNNLPPASTVTYASSVNSMRDAHGVQAESRRSDISITALSFLDSSRSHLLLTASEANASVKLWDLRGKYTSRRNSPAIPVSSTEEPEAHTRFRQFGISSLALSGDGSRFYALCRDSTLYAYSTNHLILGSAPELETPGPASKWFRPRQGQKGLGPLYGFRHPDFLATSFYVKCALRPAMAGKPEMLAVGSRDGCAVLFPTDETLLKRPKPYNPISASQSADVDDDDDALPSRPPPSSGPSAPPKPQALLPIYTHGTALTRGHTSEVTGMAWTNRGELVTLGDDFSARCWREKDVNAARDMRLCGEGGGARWGWGWADVGDKWDEEEG